MDSKKLSNIWQLFYYTFGVIKNNKQRFKCKACGQFFIWGTSPNIMSASLFGFVSGHGASY